MNIRLTKKQQRHQLTCVRDDGSPTAADLGVGELPDLAFD
jgi:hypothetical protein